MRPLKLFAQIWFVFQEQSMRTKKDTWNLISDWDIFQNNCFLLDFKPPMNVVCKNMDWILWFFVVQMISMPKASVSFCCLSVLWCCRDQVNWKSVCLIYRFHSFLLFLGHPPYAIREVSIHRFSKILSEFALEYRTTRERVLQQKQKRANHRERNKTRGKMITEVSVNTCSTRLLYKV